MKAFWKVRPPWGQRLYLRSPMPGFWIPTAIMVSMTALKMLMNAILCQCKEGGIVGEGIRTSNGEIRHLL
jgi:hypothetical protein